MAEQKDQPTFAEASGTEANQHAKKLSKAKSKAAKSKKEYEFVFSQRGLKIVKITMKPSGAYQEYVGSIASKKKERTVLLTEIAKWKKDKMWIAESDIEEYTSNKIEALQK